MGNVFSILVVDDSDASREIVKFLIEKRGYAASTAANGKEAIHTVESGSFDIILMDIQMPIMNGFDAAREIRHMEKLNHGNAVIIALTAYTSQEEIEKCISAGMNDYLIKPIQPHSLYEKLDKWLSNS